MTDAYLQFLQEKVRIASSAGFEVADADIHPLLKPHQRASVRWACQGGRRALFEAFGLGKSVQQIELLRLCMAHAGAPVLIVLLWRKVHRRGPGECWLWTGRRDKDGYGTLRVGSTQLRAHRFSYEMHRGPTDLLIRHKCNNAPCVNPAHLEPGTHLDNMADRKAAGHYARRGS